MNSKSNRLYIIGTPIKIQAMYTYIYTLILEEPYSVQPFFVFTLPALLVKSVIDRSIIDLALGASQEFAIR